jgi:hypothetical protein
MSEAEATQGMTWIASSLSMMGAAALVLSRDLENSFAIKSHLGLPFYAAGIFQWFLFGVYSKNWALILPCGLQFIPLGILLKTYLRTMLQR